MAVDESLKEPTQELNRSLREIMSIYSLVASQAPFWYGRLLSAIVIATEDEELRYITATHNADKKTALVVVFTENLLVKATVTDTSKDDSPVTTLVSSRRGLDSIGVATSEGVFSASAFSNWPGDLTLELVYGEQSIALPLEHPMSGDRSAPVRALLATLRADLRTGS